MDDTPTLWQGARGWALDVAFVAAAGVAFLLIGGLENFFAAPLEFRLIWPETLLAGGLLFGGAIRAAAALDGRWRIPGLVWLIAGLALADAPLAAMAGALVTHFWPVLKATSFWGWYVQSAFFWVPVVGVYAVLTRQLWRLRPAQPQQQPAPRPDQPGRIPGRLMHAIIALNAEDDCVRVYTRTGSELAPGTLREALVQIGYREGARVHRAWWVARDAVAEALGQGDHVRLRLVNGLEVPVSPNQVDRLRTQGWFAPPKADSPKPTRRQPRPRATGAKPASRKRRKT